MLGTPVPPKTRKHPGGAGARQMAQAVLGGGGSPLGCPSTPAPVTPGRIGAGGAPRLLPALLLSTYPLTLGGCHG